MAYRGIFRGALPVLLMLSLGGCASFSERELDEETLRNTPDYNYVIGPGDNVNIFVWRNPDVSNSVPVRPDGKITTALVEDLQASGKQPSQLARDLEKSLSKYIKEPLVTVIVTGFVGPYDQQIRVIGQAAKPQALPYREKMTLLDVMIAVGGITEFANGNATTLVRRANGEEMEYRVRIDDLIKDGDISANVHMLPGDILIIPESWF
ncbi:MAG: polysaccharide biosynthesis/export family protein [Gammaproteobacteria bacterium]|nr:polysaccharide biosynthesis/export family protein [Gammaproteobacteria bacterium]